MNRIKDEGGTRGDEGGQKKQRKRRKRGRRGESVAKNRNRKAKSGKDEEKTRGIEYKHDEGKWNEERFFF
jgi:hypothetical protein